MEKGYNDTGATLSWSITANTTLKDSAYGKFKLSTLNDLPMTTIDGASPRIAYTLALPGKIKFSITSVRACTTLWEPEWLHWPCSLERVRYPG